ncbi:MULTISPECIES: Asp-tRNA(Asn)/Glu-tRNA(Gln) amidotransferase subunit GatA [Methanohalophilus]|jgi:aspartyl-tRNA(Asn)/glutamyl-tRNA(Gln) amidotransferase subunit A|uniref:Glutamyl-tRNA(Gln) amidotransferase subunit A n=1 Tax=Methanohalophilus euhalobius TaxID=51203 RepID=A0A285GCJ2_9EURY|nr:MULTISPECIES: Asp-tRNA(Asn)/Glu-tRNA(Gln) amidotransferase subunit GatA [Methanohalophilus]KXS46491.1 MAG: aspartyl-tRNA(Asn)/glutamyl-tRNA (Gln) amidotransferase subunit A [Methanohalophilus sp. T328-1]RSD36399.1 MAG: aspartyl-tRNA(Asn)/glutamyl-tRNA (Gln) amidotransferase subunit A [Methanohalophilus sp.]OBZ35879.1 MAG: glutaminyl-tRNA synthase (glutamine-hydrolyzing) subunit A [Methanohalophilus sp. DAL1]ODV50233.1 MAG: aspartyl-tRNA(Asn)/glutamyl-tRNA (Gln) amidotransferase subunit A [Me
MLEGLSDLKNKIGSSSAEDVVASYLERIEKSDINAFTCIAEDAIDQARKVDSLDIEGPLAGVPIAIKDNISTKGLSTTCSSAILDGYVPPYDAHVIERLRKAGAVIIGKSNMDEFGMGTSTETSTYGPTLNPWDAERVAGGSSGGSAAAVAAGQVPVSLGSDTGGSVRCPAAFCGTVGLKPTYGAVSRYGLVSYANSLEQIGPLANRVEDVAALMDVIGTYDNRDSTCVKHNAGYTDALQDDVEGLKIGVPAEYFGEGIDDNVQKLVWEAIGKFEDMGAEYTKVSMPNTPYALAAYYIIAMSEASSNLARFDGTRYGNRSEGENWHMMASKTRQEKFGAEVKRRILLGTYALSAGYHDKYYLKALKVRTLVKQDFERAFEDVDVLMAPTMPTPAFKIGEKMDDPLSLYLSDVNTVPINLAGVPSISVPCGFSEGLPVGLQVIGNYFDEATILKAAHSFEKNTNHHTKLAPGVV